MMAGWLANLAATELPDGFNETLVVSGLPSPTAMAVAPDGRLFVCQQNGQLRIVKDGALLSQPFLMLTTDPTGERGLLGVAFDPGFATNQFVYVHYTVPALPSHNRVSRFTAAEDVAVPGSEVVLLDLDELSATANHNGGALGFGREGKLFIATGDNARSFKSPALDNLLGKVLRLNPDGTIPEDNPFYLSATGVNRAIWATGLRNPFTFAIQPGTGRLFINDVGEVTWEEINEASGGADFGWPAHEGPSPDNLGFTSPLHAYGHGVGEAEGCAITGGTFYNPSLPQFPPGFIGKYFFADYCAGWIRVLDPADPDHSEPFASGLAAPVALAVGLEGALYYLSRGSSALFKIQASGSPGIVAHPVDQVVTPGATAIFTVAASGAEPLAYQWRCNGTNIPAATNVSHAVTGTSPADSGRQFAAVVNNPYGCVTSNPALLLVTTDPPPLAVITQPVPGTKYRGGDTIHFAGTATAGDGSPLAVEGFTWMVAFHHGQHTHPFLGPIAGVTNGSFTIPTSGETASDVFYRIQLTATNGAGLASRAGVDLEPRTSILSLLTTPPGLRVTVGGQPMLTPATVTSVVSMARSLGVVSPQSLNGTTFGFLKWSDGGAATHGISTPETNTTYVASFVSDADPPVLNLAPAGPAMVLSWPAISTGFVAQAARTLVPGVPWEVATNLVTTSGIWYSTEADTSAGGAFFRLASTSPVAPWLSFSHSGSTLLLRWPTQAVGCILESTRSLTPVVPWKLMTNPITLINEQHQLLISQPTGNQFFRLMKP